MLISFCKLRILLNVWQITDQLYSVALRHLKEELQEAHRSSSLGRFGSERHITTSTAVLPSPGHEITIMNSYEFDFLRSLVLLQACQYMYILSCSFFHKPAQAIFEFH